MANRILRKGISGALIGAGVGMGVTIAVELMKGTVVQDDSPPALEKTKQYANVWEDPDLSPIMEDFAAFRETSPEAFEKLLQDLDKFSGTVALVLSFSKPTKRNGEKFSEGWAISAHHHAEGVRDGISAIEFSILDSMRETFAEKKKEMLTYLENGLFNVNQHTQVIMDKAD